MSRKPLQKTGAHIAAIRKRDEAVRHMISVKLDANAHEIIQFASDIERYESLISSHEWADRVCLRILYQTDLNDR